MTASQTIAGFASAAHHSMSPGRQPLQPLICQSKSTHSLSRDTSSSSSNIRQWMKIWKAEHQPAGNEYLLSSASIKFQSKTMKFVSIFPRNKTGSDDVARAFVQSDPMINFAVVCLKFAHKLGLYSTIWTERKIYPSILRAIDGDHAWCSRSNKRT